MAVFDIAAVDVALLNNKEVFVLDANVLYWLFAGYVLPATHKDYPKAQTYSNFIGQLISQGNTLGASVGNVQEVLNIIERTEFELYKNNGNPNLSKKAFRKDSTQRASVQRKVSAAYQAIVQSCQLFDLSLEKARLGVYIAEMLNHTYDPMDFFVAHDIVKKQHINYVTNDPDFRSDENLNVYTIM